MLAMAIFMCLVSELGREAVGVMALIKKSLDPNGIMNPGKIIDDSFYL